MLGLYRDNGKEYGHYYIIMGYFVSSAAGCRKIVCSGLLAGVLLLVLSSLLLVMLLLLLQEVLAAWMFWLSWLLVLLRRGRWQLEQKMIHQ